MKKVAFFIESNAVGGAERVLRDITNYVDTQKFDITVISLFKKPVYGGTSQFVDFFRGKYRWIVNNENAFLSKVGNFLINRFPTFFYTFFIGSSYDIIVAFYEGMPTNLISRIKVKSKKIAWLHTTVDLSLPNRSQAELKKTELMYSHFDRIVAVSKGAANGFVDLFPNLENKVVVAYNPIDLSRIEDLSTSSFLDRKNVFTFVAVGRVIPCKGYERLIKAASKLKKDGLQFSVWIIGGGGNEHLKLLAEKYGVAEFFTFLGNQSNPYIYMKQADCVVSSSYIEGFGLTLVEGLALGKLVLATDCGCTAEIIGEHNEYGIVMENSEDGIYRAMRKVLDDKRIKLHYEERATERARYFDVHNTIKLVERALSC